MKPLFYFSALLMAGLLAAACAKEAQPKLKAPPVSLGQDSPAKSTAPIVNGTVNKGEYNRTYNVGPFTLHVSRVKGNMYLGLSVNTKGWVAVGLGSPIMNGAVMFLGNVQNGKSGFTEQVGRGHRHSEVAEDKRTVITHAVREQGGVTTVEVECRAAQFVPDGTNEITVLIAYAADDSFATRHRERKSLKVRLD
jgi:hypothetical protein